jgi:2-methylisocitrate lyase-like PEP mutase family enzyme
VFGVKDLRQIEAMVKAVAPKPLNVLVGTPVGFKVSDLADVGVRRVSVGSALARVAWTAFANVARGLADDGGFVGFAGILSTKHVSKWFAPTP